MSRWNFYKKNIVKFIKLNSKILIVGGSDEEYKLFNSLGYKKITISNLSLKKKKKIKYLNIDAQKIPFKDNSFDYVVTHATLHHMRKPHLALIEMYRVSKIGALIIEGNDSLLMSFSVMMNFSEKYELSSVDKKNSSGGVEESGFPNFIFRWKEREVIKTLSSYEPEKKHKIIFNYGNDLENSGVQNYSILKTFFFKFLKIILKIFFIFFKKQQNIMSIFIDKINSKINYFN